MKFTVIISGPALDELQYAYNWLVQRTAHAPRWYNGLLDTILSLEDHPSRWPLAPEDDQASEETRQLLYGDRRHSYRIFFSIRGDEVWILHIRHGARR